MTSWAGVLFLVTGKQILDIFWRVCHMTAKQSVEPKKYNAIVARRLMVDVVFLYEVFKPGKMVEAMTGIVKCFVHRTHQIAGIQESAGGKKCSSKHMQHFERY